MFKEAIISENAFDIFLERADESSFRLFALKSENAIERFDFRLEESLLNFDVLFCDNHT